MIFTAQATELGQIFTESIKGQEPIVVLGICAVFVLIVMVFNSRPGNKALATTSEGLIKIAQTAQGENISLRTDLSESNDLNMTLSEQLNSIRLQLKDMQAELIASNRRADKAEARADKSEAEANAKADAIQLALDEANGKLDDLKKQLEDSEAEKFKLQEEINKLRALVEELRLRVQPETPNRHEEVSA